MFSPFSCHKQIPELWDIWAAHTSKMSPIKYNLSKNLKKNKKGEKNEFNRNEIRQDQKKIS